MQIKILLLKQSVTDLDTLNKGIALAKKYALTIGLDLQFTFKNSVKPFSSIPVSNDVVINGYVVNPVEIFQEAKKWGIPFDVALLVFDWTKITPQPTNPADGGMAISIPTQWFVTYPEVFAEFFLHELNHYYATKLNVLDLTHKKFDPMWKGQFDSKSNIVYYLYLLKRFMQPYIYFKLTESTGKGHTIAELKPELMQKLDTARTIANIPFKITSGFRTIAENQAVGGVSNSAHLTGEAVDIACIDSQGRFKIVNALLDQGFKRIELATQHIHCDISKTLPQEVLVLSEKS